MKSLKFKKFLTLRNSGNTRISKKAQAAMEFLMTYGWAILVVLVAIGALAYFGILSPNKILPDICTMEVGFACMDFKITYNGVALLIINSLGKNIQVNDIIIDGVPTCTLTLNDINKSLKKNSYGKFTIGGEGTECLISGDSLSSDFTIIYTPTGGLQRSKKGYINGKLEGITIEEVEFSDPSVCEEAETNGLCGVLDLLYGEGYEALCCSEQEVCC